MFPWLHMSDLIRHMKQMLAYPSMWKENMMHLSFWNIEPSCIIITKVTVSAHIRYILYHKVTCFLFFWGVGVEPIWPNVNLTLSLIVMGGGLSSYAMSLYPLSIPSIPRQNSKKININRDIGLSSLNFVQNEKEM